MNREELKKYIGVSGYSLGQVEKDYFQHIILAKLSRDLAGVMVFKGGTAMQKIGLIPRFSEDLDFTLTKETTVEKLMTPVKNVLKTYNYEAEYDNFKDDTRTLGFRIKIIGPLFRNNKGLCTIKVEVSRREEVFLSPETHHIDTPYSNILPYVLNIMDLSEMAAEKVRTILTRDKARDLYDLYMLIGRGIVIHRDMVNKKLKYYDMKFDQKIYEDRCKLVSRNWSKELDSLMETTPPEDVVLDRLTDQKIWV